MSECLSFSFVLRLVFLVLLCNFCGNRCSMMGGDVTASSPSSAGDGIQDAPTRDVSRPTWA